MLVRSFRRCCLCFFHDQVDTVRRGQIAHLNRDPNDHSVNNLVWLCLDHHAEYDSRSSQSKGWKTNEVCHWRDEMYARIEERVGDTVTRPSSFKTGPEAAASEAPTEVDSQTDKSGRPWRFPLWQIADRPEFFAYSARNNCDGVCVIERIDLPDERVVVACIQVAGNPGASITNTIETIVEQVCARFEISPERVIWLENYEFSDPEEWRLATFGAVSADGGARNPSWKRMSLQDWDGLQLRPRPRLDSSHADLVSKIEKLFPWPPVDYMLG